MAGSMSDFLELKIIDLMTGKAAYSLPTANTIWLGLWTLALSDTSTGSTAGEVSGGSYVRKQTAAADWNSASGSGAGAGSTTNATLLTFVQATATWGTIQWFGIFDAATVGNMLGWSDISPSLIVNNGDQAKFNIGAITITLL